MAKVVRGVDSYKKEFLSIFNSLCGRHGRWEVWSDFIQLTAIDISNVTDKANAPKRAADARNIAKKYSEDEIKRMAEMLMQMVYAIDEKPDQDFLGELYMTCELGNDHAGQFFTPYSVCQAMSEISFDPARFEDIGFVSVNDCACGAGALLVSFANVCKRHDINYQQKVMFVAQDIDYTVGLMCYIQLSLMGCAGYVVIGGTLINPCTAYDKKRPAARRRPGTDLVHAAVLRWHLVRTPPGGTDGSADFGKFTEKPRKCQFVHGKAQKSGRFARERHKKAMFVHRTCKSSSAGFHPSFH